MPAQLWSEFVGLAVAYGLIAASSFPVLCLAHVLARRGPQRLVPAYRCRSTRWQTIDVAGLFILGLLIPGFFAGLVETFQVFPTLVEGATEAAKNARMVQLNTVARVLGLPVLVGGFLVWKRTARTEPFAPVVRVSRLAADVRLGILTWLGWTPIVFVVHGITSVLYTQWIGPPDSHPLKDARLEGAADVVLFLLGACLLAPVFEEVMFRRAVVPWAGRRLDRSVGLMVVTCAVTGLYGGRPGPIIFAAVLGVGMLFGLRIVRRGTKATAAVWTSSALFAMVHASVWPSPIPLFVLALALGWLVHRTGGMVAGVVVHGLFNLVSAVAMLRGTA